jgi:malonyl CoA-acyl carrier protein transacylase
MSAGVPLPEVAGYSGHSVGELAAVAAGDGRLRSQTTLAVYTHATGQARERALEAVGRYLVQLLPAAPRLRAARVLTAAGLHRPARTACAPEFLATLWRPEGANLAL